MNILKKLRMERNLSQLDIANLINVTQSNYGRIENGQTKLSRKYQNQLANFYHISIEELLGIEIKKETQADTLSKQEIDVLILFRNLTDTQKMKAKAYLLGMASNNNEHIIQELYEL